MAKRSDPRGPKGGVATCPRLSWGSGHFESGEEEQIWPTGGLCCYITLAVLSPMLSTGTKSEMAHVGTVAISPLPSRGSPTLQSKEDNQKSPTGGQRGRLGGTQLFRAGKKFWSAPLPG